MNSLRAMIILFLLVSPAALACTMISTTDEVKFMGANHVLFVRVVSATLLRNETIEVRYDVIETLKGQGEPRFAKHDVWRGGGDCAMTFSVGNHYVLFLHGRERYAGLSSHIAFPGDPKLDEELSKFRALARKRSERH